MVKNPGSIIYILVHIILVLIGVVITSLDSFDDIIARSLRESLGVGILSAGVVGIVVFVYVRHTEHDAKSVEQILKSGLRRAFEGRSTRIKEEYDSRLRSAKSIDLLGLGLSAFREDYRDEIARLASHARIRVLVLDPEFPKGATYADQRDKEEGNPEGRIRMDVQAFVASFRELTGRFPQNISIRYYSCTPSVNILRIDDEMFWGPYLSGRQSRNMPTFIVQRDGFLFENLQSHFDRIWRDNTLSRPI